MYQYLYDLYFGTNHAKNFKVVTQNKHTEKPRDRNVHYIQCQYKYKILCVKTYMK